MRFRQLSAAPALLLATFLLQAGGSGVEPPETAEQGGVVIDPTAANFHSMLTHLPGQPDWAATAARQAEMVKKLHDNGVQLVAGTDDMPPFSAPP